jgi:hypothetical protein
MMKLAVLAAVAGSAVAFAPSPMAKTVTSLSSAFENEIGALPPTGFWDPAGLSDGISQERFDEYRLAELKHGRVAQLAVLGYIAPETYRFGYDLVPGEVNTADIPNGIAAINAVPFLGWVQIFAFVGCVETYGWFTSPTGVLQLPADILAKRQTAELQHGRLAMLAFLELIRHDSQNLVTPAFDGYDHLITGLPFIYSN